MMGPERFDLHVLCHTLAVEEIQRALAILQELRPTPKVLSLQDEGFGGALPVHVLNTFIFPQLLLTTVSRILEIDLEKLVRPSGVV